METFEEKRGYVQGTYEGQLQGEGFDVSALKATGGYGENINPDEAAKIRSQFGGGENPYFNASQAITSQATRPDDLLGIRSEIHSQLGVGEALESAEAARQKLIDFDKLSGEQQQEVTDRLVSLGKLTGIKDSQADKRALARKSYAIEEQTMQDVYRTKMGEASTQMAYREKEISEKKQMMAQFSGAGITFSDSFESALAKAEKYTEVQEKEAKRDAEYDALRNAYTQVYGYPPKDKYNRKKLRSKIKKKSKGMLKKAESRADEEWQMKVEQHQADLADVRSSIAGEGAPSYDDKYGVIKYREDATGERVYERLNKETGQMEIVPMAGVEAEAEEGIEEGDSKSFWDYLGWGASKVEGGVGKLAERVPSQQEQLSLWSKLWK